MTKKSKNRKTQGITPTVEASSSQRVDNAQDSELDGIDEPDSDVDAGPQPNPELDSESESDTDSGSSSDSDSDELGLFKGLRGKRNASDGESEDIDPRLQAKIDELESRRILGIHRRKKRKLSKYRLEEVEVKTDLLFTSLPCTIEATERSGPKTFKPHRSVALPKDIKQDIPQKAPRVFNFDDDNDDDQDEVKLQTAYKTVYRRIPKKKKPRKPAKGKGKGKGEEEEGKGNRIPSVDMQVKKGTPVIQATSGKPSRVSKAKKKQPAKKAAKGTTNTSCAKPQQQTKSADGAAAAGPKKSKFFADDTKPGFFTLPPEIRELIYCYLLVSNKPIRVHEEWRLVYPRQGLCLFSTVLQVHSVIFKEASSVLYGKNNFKYVLRDSKNSIMVDDSVGVDDTPWNDFEEFEDDGHDHETSGNKSNRQARPRITSRKASRLSDTDIHLAKYIGLMRRITVEAEENRNDEHTKLAMERALKVFTPTEHRRRLIHETEARPSLPQLLSVTLRIAPTKIQQSWVASLDTPPAFTFVDFFTRGSPVMKMLHLIQCKWLYVNMVDPDKVKGTRMKRKNKVITTGLDLQLDMETLTLLVQKNDTWKHDDVIRTQRKKRLSNCNRHLRELDKTVYRHLRDNDARLQKQMNNPEHDNDWDDDDDGDGDGDGDGDDMEDVVDSHELNDSEYENEE